MSSGVGMSGGGGGGRGGGEQRGKRGPDGGQLQLPPGFRFYPSDEELVVDYLCKKAASQPFAVPIIAEVDLYKFDPWDLPAKALFGEKEWYFFSPRDRKYPNGSRPNRAAGSGYWKATGTDKPICMQPNGGGQKVGVKKALVFYTGRPPKGEKTNWIMHEYRLADGASKAAKRKGSLRLDDWVLCRIYKKLPSATRLAMQKEEVISEDMNEFDEVLEGLPHLEEDSKLTSVIKIPSTTPMMSFSTPYNTTHMSTDQIMTNGHNLNDSFYKPGVSMMGAQAQMGSYSLGGHLMNKTSLIPPHMNHEVMDKNLLIPQHLNHEVMDKSYIPSNYYFKFTNQPHITIPNWTPENSPVRSSVDEERGLPMDKCLPTTNLPFNFDALPSPFGRLESLQHLPF